VIRPLLTVLLLAAACAPSVTPTPSVRFAMYQYVLQVPTKPVTPNERLKLAWKPQLASAPTPATFETLKKAATQDARSCPPAGAIATSQTLRVASNAGDLLAADLTVPSTPGFYNLLQISILGSGNSTSAGSVIEVR
jgi:hypothetical protein